MDDGRHAGVDVQLDVGVFETNGAVDEGVAEMTPPGPTAPTGALLFLRRGGGRLGFGRRLVHEYENVEISERTQFQRRFDQDGGERSDRHTVVRLITSAVVEVLVSAGCR